MKMTEDYVFFWGGTFSNFFKVKGGVNYKNHNFPTTEHAFMYAKALHFKDEDIAEQLLTVSRDPKKAKALGRKVKNFSDLEWDKVKYQIMLDVNREKYKQEDARKELLDTGRRKLVEASPFDRVWGVKMSENDPLILNPKNWKGQNLLGKVLDDAKAEILEEESK